MATCLLPPDHGCRQCRRDAVTSHQGWDAPRHQATRSSRAAISGQVGVSPATTGKAPTNHAVVGFALVGAVDVATLVACVVVNVTVLAVVLLSFI